MTEFAYRPLEASATLLALRRLPEEGTSRILGSKLAQAQVHTLIGAEFLAAQAGLVPYITLPDGTRGVGVIGGARTLMDGRGVREDVRTAYLAAHSVARHTAITAKPSPEAQTTIGGLALAEPLLAEPPPIGLLGVDDLAIAVVVLGVAAICATAWYAAETRKAIAEIENRKALQLAQTDAMLAIAREQLAKTGQIQDDVVKALAPWSVEEAAHSGDVGAVFGRWAPFAIAAGLAVGAGYWFLAKKGAAAL